MHITLWLARTNSLSYLVPLANYLRFNKHDVSFLVYGGGNFKYNSFSIPENRTDTLRSLSDMGYAHKLIEEQKEPIDIETDILFTVEGSNEIPNVRKKTFKHVIIQNYLDFSFSAQYPKTENVYKNCDAMWFNNLFFANLAKNIGFNKKQIIGITPNYWLYSQQTRQATLARLNIEQKKDKIAVCFMPRPNKIVENSWKDVSATKEENDIDWGEPALYFNHAIVFAKHLKDNGFQIIFKQRIKDRNLDLYENKKIAYFEDRLWFPLTALDLSYVSDISYGYMTSAFLDSHVFIKNYINFTNKNIPYAKITKDIFKNFINNKNIKEYDLTQELSNITFSEPSNSNEIFIERVKLALKNFNAYLSEAEKEL